MKQLMMIAMLAAFAMPAARAVWADDMNPTDTRAEFAARKANHGKYVPAKPMHHKHMGKKHMAHKPMAKPMHKPMMKKAK